MHRDSTLDGLADLVFLNMADGVATFDRSRRIGLWNPAISLLLGISEAQARGQVVTDVLPSLDDRILDGVLHGQTYIVSDLEQGHGDPKQRSTACEIRCMPLRSASGDILGGLIQCRDISDSLRKAGRQSARLQSVLDLAPLAMSIAVGPDLVYTYYNEAFSEQIGHRSVLGKRARDAYPDLLNDDLITLAEEVYRTGVSVRFSEREVPVRGSDREVFTHFLSGAILPWRDEQDEIVGVLGVTFNVTDHLQARKAAETSESRLHLALQAGQCAVWEWDVERDISWRSELHDKLLGFSRPFDVWNRESFLASVHPDDRDRVTSEVERILRECQPFELEWRSLGEDGQTRWLRDVGRVITDENGRPVRVVAVMFDITHLKMTETALVKAKEAAEVANRAKTTFVANLSHELRTPLTALLGFSEFLGRDNLAAPRRAAYIEGVHRNGQLIVKLIDDILDLSRVEAGRLNIELSAVDPRTVAGDVLVLFREKVAEKNIEIGVTWADTVPRRIRTDPLRLRQILANVVGNAIKFTAKGRVQIRLECGPGETLCFFIEDTGIGITQEQVGLLFQPFGQADRSIRKEYGGYGLGLAISRGLARALDGDVELVKSQVGVGSVFVVRVRDQGITSGTVETSYEPSTALDCIDSMERRRLLIVEDTEDLRELLAQSLSESGFEIATAGDGAEALGCIAKFAAEAVIMDLRLPVMDGFEATRALREQGFRGPIVALSAHGSPEELLRHREDGFDAYLVKPVPTPELVSLISRLIDSQVDTDQAAPE